MTDSPRMCNAFGVFYFFVKINIGKHLTNIYFGITFTLSITHKISTQ